MNRALASTTRSSVCSFTCAILLSLCSLVQLALGASSPQPPMPKNYKATLNSVRQKGDTYEFVYKGSGKDSLVYRYEIKRGGTFNALTAQANGRFHPSNYGGIGAVFGGVEKKPWDNDVSFRCLSHSLSAGVVTARWAMSANSEEIRYTFRLQIKGRTLVLQAEAEPGYENATGIYLDRCEGASRPKVIPVPYLTLFNVLLANGNFVSLFADWESTNASEIAPLCDESSPSSVSYAQNVTYRPKTDGKRNRLQETVYLTVSPNLEDVLPQVPNPVSSYKQVCAQQMVLDYWLGFNMLLRETKTLADLYRVGGRNIWLIVHNWQFKGYDNAYPSVLPANPEYGGDTLLSKISQTAKAYKYLFGVHENYIDYHENASDFRTDYAAKSKDREDMVQEVSAAPGKDYPHGHKVFLLKPSRAAEVSNIISQEIHRRYNTTSSFLDISSSANPSQFVDFDASAPDAGLFRATLKRYRTLMEQLRRIHAGPVSGEGRHHFLYLGYIDDVEAQINTGDPEVFGHRAPLLVDFDLTRLHSIAAVHGVGYYQRFFSVTDGTQNWGKFPLDSVLSYFATELAYGHGSFIPDETRLKGRLLDHALMEQKFVFPAQQAYGNANPVRITYGTAGGKLVPASEYIRLYPDSFADIHSPDFMGQVKVEYDNGVIVYVNRNPKRSWGSVTVGATGGWSSYNGSVGSKTAALYAGASKKVTLSLPPANGWICYVPKSAVKK